MSNETIKVKGIAFWASLDKVNTMSGDYQISVGQLSDAAVRALESLGISVLNKGEMGNYFTCKSKYVIFAYDTEGKRITSGVGNGSEITVVVGTYPWSFKGKKGVSASCKKLVVTNLIVYTPDGGVEVDDMEAL